MNGQLRLAMVLLLSAISTGGCGGDDSDGGAGGTGGTSAGGGGGAGATGTGGTGGAVTASCESECDRQAGANCSNVSPNYASACKTLCQATRDKLPGECVDEFEAVYACAAATVSYMCNRAGQFQATPAGSCAQEGAACVTCSQDCIPGI